MCYNSSLALCVPQIMTGWLNSGNPLGTLDDPWFQACPGLFEAQVSDLFKHAGVALVPPPFSNTSAQFEWPHDQQPDQTIVLPFIQECLLNGPSFPIRGIAARILILSLAKLKQLPNVISCDHFTDDTKFLFLSDLHGRLEVLHAILMKEGVPSPSKIYVFMGDIFGRGNRCVHLFLAVLFLFISSPPGTVLLIRGNHDSCPH